MSSGKGARSNWFLALAGLEAGMVGAWLLLGYLALDSAWRRRSVWTVPNLLASTFYGQSALRSGFGAKTWAGLALLLFLYGLLGALFALVVRGQASRLRATLLGLIYAVGWFYFSDAVLWRRLNPLVALYSPDRPMLVGHLLYGVMLGRLPVYLRALVRSELPAAIPTAGGSPPSSSEA